jgi:hypothetical protein
MVEVVADPQLAATSRDFAVRLLSAAPRFRDEAST